MNNPPIARILSCFRQLGSAWRIAWARGAGARIGVGCVFGSGADACPGLAAPRAGRIAMGDRCELGQGVLLHPYRGNITLGCNVYVGPYTVIFGHGGVEIGDDTLIAMHCRIVAANHAIPPAESSIRDSGDIAEPVRIGSDVWLGAGVTVLAGVTIGDGCVVGAGAVVTRDLPPYSIAVGVPARVVGQRPLS